jgi:hypothetical protein
VVTFQDILSAFGKYKVDGSKASWDALWLKSNTLMTALLTKELCKRGVCKDDREAITTDAVSNIMAMFKQAHFADIAWVESRFSIQRKAALKVNTWATKKAAIVFSISDSTTPIVNILQKPCQPCDF